MVWFIGYLYYLCITCEKKIKRPAALKYWIMFLPLAGHWIKLVMFFYCSSISSIIFFLAHSGQMMFSPSYVLMYIQIVNAVHSTFDRLWSEYMHLLISQSWPGWSPCQPWSLCRGGRRSTRCARPTSQRPQTWCSQAHPCLVWIRI